MSVQELPRLTAGHIGRGVRRALADMGYRTITEFQLPSGRRADVMAVNAKCDILIVELKSSVADFRSDTKWSDYLEYCDAFYFGVGPDFPQTLIPDHCGLLIADAYGACLVRACGAARLNAARRRSLILQWGLAAAARLHRIEDPGISF